MDTKKLRQKVLDLAIHGKLVKQDSNDEPASILLDRIRAEKARLVKEGKIKKSELKYSTISAEEILFDLPKGWSWVRLGELGEYRKGPFGSSLTKSMFVPKSTTSYKVYEQKNAIKKDAIIGDYYISEEKFREMQGFVVKPNDIIVSCAGTIGETFVIPQVAPVGIINQALMRVRLYDVDITPFWLLYFEYTTTFTSDLDGSGTAIKNIPPFEILKNLVFPLPPLAEQHRIVKAVDELFEQIDIIEQSEKELEEAANKTRDKLLNLAIQGHQVPQDPNEEPASVLLERIRAEKARLVKEGKLKKKDLEEKPISPDEIPFDIPEGWVWCRLGDIFLHSSGKQLSGSNKEGTLHQYITTSNLYWGRFELDNLKSMYYKDSELEKCTAIKGDLLVCEGGDIGRSAIWPFDYDICLQNHVHRLRPFDNGYTKFVYYIMMLFKSLDMIGGRGIAIQGLSASALKSIIIPLPPLSEQRRIVTKLEELLQEIDKLKV
ncbi:MAG: restriction endonuclease subunit S [Bacteroidales bacterium]|nr:restriction endonuclease subunit S [Bacteroidales bacterium]